MYTNINYELAAMKQRDLLVQGEKERRARQVQSAQASRRPASSRSRRTRLVHRLRPQSQS
jgi:hypothetical protein